MSERSTCWSITINNPTQDEYSIVLPVGWRLEGQLEKGASGTEHYQGMLRTSQVRFSAVKKYFPRAHIEVARNPTALKKYVNKEETRVSTVQSIPTLFEYQTIIAKEWRDEEFKSWYNQFDNKTMDEVAMMYLDALVARDIEHGRRGAEYIAINPMWRSSWKTFWRSIIKRHASSVSQEGGSDEAQGTQVPGSEASPSGSSGSSEADSLVQGDLSDNKSVSSSEW